MKLLVVDIILLILTCQSFGVDDVDYVPIGCFEDRKNDVDSARALPEMLANYRVQTEKWPEIMNWNDVETSVIKKCARKTKEKGYQFFGVQFYGECWSGRNSRNTYAKYGASRKCTAATPFVGKDLANFVYMLTAENECQNYQTLNSADRSKTHSMSSLGPKCDHSSYGFQGNTWYRFAGEAGNMMAKECVKPWRCQTFRSGWYNGSYPKVSDGIRTGQACFSWHKNCCDSNVSVKIRNCSEYFVYKLYDTVKCMERYCGNGLPGS